jgi:hypothetical protein
VGEAGFHQFLILVCYNLTMSDPKDQSLQNIADKGASLYEGAKERYEIGSKGKFLAIEVEKGNFYLGETSKEAVEKARAENPGKLFYVVKIGFNSVETLAHSLVGHS